MGNEKEIVMKKMIISALLALMLFATATTAMALPKPCNAHYPRGGMVPLSPIQGI